MHHKDSIALWIIEYRGDQSFVAKPVELEFIPAPEHYVLPEPTLELRSQYAFELIRALLDGVAENEWIYGNPQVKGARDAVKLHLEDMRKLNDKLLAMIQEKL